jgi:AraC-like DNA-binding protein
MLQEKSISFQKIYDDVRKRTALQLMHNPLISKDQIAEKLGYSSISSFNRAQKRWEAE